MRCSSGATPLIVAVEKGQREIVGVVNSRQDEHQSAQSSRQHVAANNGDVAVMKVLLDHAAKYGNISTLHIAAWEGHSEVARLLTTGEQCTSGRQRRRPKHTSLPRLVSQQGRRDADFNSRLGRR